MDRGLGAARCDDRYFAKCWTGGLVDERCHGGRRNEPVHRFVPANFFFYAPRRSERDGGAGWTVMAVVGNGPRGDGNVTNCFSFRWPLSNSNWTENVHPAGFEPAVMEWDARNESVAGQRAGV